MTKELEKSIIQTLAYFDYFNHPLTAVELYRFLWCPPNVNFADFLIELETINPACLEFKMGYYFLAGRSEVVDIRRSKSVDNDRKNKRARKAAQKIRWVPFVKAVMLCNNTSFEMAGPASDIDVVIVIKDGRMWIGRLLVTLLLTIFRLRRTKKKTTNRICLSFYASGRGLDFSSLKITEPDIGLMFWIMQFVALYDPENILPLIWDKNVWIKKYLPHAYGNSQMGERFFVVDNCFSRRWKSFWEKIWGGVYGNLIESQARAIQKLKMKLNTGSVQNEPDTRVVISDQILKFHEKDRRLAYKEYWDKTVNNYLV